MRAPAPATPSVKMIVCASVRVGWGGGGHRAECCFSVSLPLCLLFSFCFELT